jgi:signal transduction histidine kinase
MQPPDFGEAPRRTQELLLESEERFRLLVEGVKDYAIFMLDAEGNVTTWNLGAQRINIVGASTIARDITERRRIARDLHDGVLQDLSYTAAAIGLIMLEVEGTRLEEELQSTIDAVRRSAQGLRDAVNDLRLEEERDRPFPELVESLVRRNRARTPGCEITLEVEEGFPSRPLGETGTELLRILQEAITNARRHSGAQRVSVTLKVEGRDLVAEVSDDGRGFGPQPTPGVGLSSMRERAAIIGGELEIESEPGQGTSVRLRVLLPRGPQR